MGTGEEVAIKLESVRSKHPQLLYESKVLRYLKVRNNPTSPSEPVFRFRTAAEQVESQTGQSFFCLLPPLARPGVSTTSRRLDISPPPFGQCPCSLWIAPACHEASFSGGLAKKQRGDHRRLNTPYGA